MLLYKTSAGASGGSWKGFLKLCFKYDVQIGDKLKENNITCISKVLGHYELLEQLQWTLMYTLH